MRNATDDPTRAVLSFWFGSPEPGPDWRERAEWFGGGTGFDSACRDRLAAPAADAAAGRLDGLTATREGALALVLLLDQLPRNIHRGTPAAFAGDARARAVASSALERGFDAGLPDVARLFLYMPFEHSEDLADQERAVALIGALGTPDWLDYALRHRAVIVRFGRFPHRNAILGRASTPAEATFLDEPGSSF